MLTERLASPIPQGWTSCNALLFQAHPAYQNPCEFDPSGLELLPGVAAVTRIYIFAPRLANCTLHGLNSNNSRLCSRASIYPKMFASARLKIGTPATHSCLTSTAASAKSSRVQSWKLGTPATRSLCVKSSGSAKAPLIESNAQRAAAWTST